MHQKKVKESSNRSSLILIGIQISIFLIFVLLKQFNVNSFNGRIIGDALANGIDITQIINTYYIILFVLIPGIAIGISKLFKYIFDEKDNKMVKYMSNVALLGIILSVLNLYDIIINNNDSLEMLYKTLFSIAYQDISSLVKVYTNCIDKELKNEFSSIININIFDELEACFKKSSNPYVIK